MKWKTSQLNEQNCSFALKRSELEFFLQTQLFPNFHRKYLRSIRDDHFILYTEGFEGEEIAASFIQVFTKIKYQGEILKSCFLTQVIISTNFRKQNRIYQLISESDRLALNYGAGISFVIARKSVTDLYYKCGYSGFSHFSSFYTEKNFEFKDHHLSKFRKANIEDVSRIKLLHEYTYKDINFFFPRSIKTFSDLINGTDYEFYIDNNNEYYFVSNGNSIIEIGLARSCKVETIFEAAAMLGLNKFSLNRNHLLFKYAVKNNFHFEDRFEEKEGHLLKVYEKNCPIPNFSSSITIGPEHYSEICEIDQW